MTSKEHLIEQHIREYEARLKHIDELYEQAQEATEHLHDQHESLPEPSWRLRSYYMGEEHERDQDHVEKWREETEMAIWDVSRAKAGRFHRAPLKS